jgi:hypothetical protein
VISYGIQERTREIGVRLALGATHGSIFTMIFKGGSSLLASGIAAGLLIALMTAIRWRTGRWGNVQHPTLNAQLRKLSRAGGYRKF